MARRQAGLTPDGAKRAYGNIVSFGARDGDRPDPPPDSPLIVTVASFLPETPEAMPLQHPDDLADLQSPLRFSRQAKSASPACAGDDDRANAPKKQHACFDPIAAAAPRARREALARGGI